MSLLKTKYTALGPHSQYLCDEVVLAQAWKKTHTYIRRHNWYADTLELDCSAVDLERKLSAWSSALADGSYQTTSAWMVPAPKTAEWEFDVKHAGGWGPKPVPPDTASTLGDPQANAAVLRPLAHIGIREQTVATAVMLCLADCVESAQGDPGLESTEAAKRGVFSYGNRLFCNWTRKGERAHFSWGNSNTYSRYFEDYQRFVARPNEIARSIEGTLQGSERLYIVKLDLSAFFDNVDLACLVDCLRWEYEAFRKNDASLPEGDDEFWGLAQRALAFSWRDEDHACASLLRDGVLPKGLAQGLVASGFFANAYLLAFDRLLGSDATSRTQSPTSPVFRIHDYCRYVDDLRLVISVDDSSSEFEEAVLAQEVSDLVQLRLTASTASRGGAGLKINSKKTELELYGAVAGESGVAARMKSLQHQLSGPFDMATLQQVETGLSGLLALAELGLKVPATPSLGSGLPKLAAVAKPKLEVRDDTLTRFSAFRLTKALRMRRGMTDLGEEKDGVSAKEVLLHDYEAVARRLIAAWAVNPSLVQVLRYALDLFPSPELLEVVTDTIQSKLMAVAEHAQSLKESKAEQAVMFYVVAELFKAGAMETGRRAFSDKALQAGNITRYREDLAVFAQAMLEWNDIPWYVQQQAALLLASVGQTTESLSSGLELQYHRGLHAFLRGEGATGGIGPIDAVAISLIGYQLRHEPKHYLQWFQRFAMRKGRAVRSDALQLIAQTDQSLFDAITRPGFGKAAAKSNEIPAHLGHYVDARWKEKPPPLPQDGWISFAKVVTHPDKVFAQENALLQLGLALTRLSPESYARPEQLTPLAIELKCSDWGGLLNPGKRVLVARFVHSEEPADPVYSTPKWCEPDFAWMYALGRLLRSAGTGELDFTARQWLLRDEQGWYFGIRSTWHKRRMGMHHSAGALGGATAAITPWFSELLLQLLRWPGIADGAFEKGLGSLESLSDLDTLLEKRLFEQAEIFGLSSLIPVYRFPVDWRLNDNRALRVVLVQGLMPLENDFTGGIADLSAPGFRARHRNHTAALLKLAYDQLLARDSVDRITGKLKVDLVVFPEYSIHVDDQDLMRAFSDSTGAMLFYGLLGATVPGTAAPANMARWLVPQLRGGNRAWIEVDQGKFHVTADEVKLGVASWRPYQVVIELRWHREPGYRMSGSVCYDATDIALAADLKDETHMFVVTAMNKDVKTFDSMVSSLRYHMYQHVLIANSGEFGGSTAQAPYDLEHKRLISHVHGSQQIAVSVFDIPVDDFGPALKAAGSPIKVAKMVSERVGKTRPAGLQRR